MNFVLRMEFQSFAPKIQCLDLKSIILHNKNISMVHRIPSINWYQLFWWEIDRPIVTKNHAKRTNPEWSTCTLDFVSNWPYKGNAIVNDCAHGNKTINQKSKNGELLLNSAAADLGFLYFVFSIPPLTSFSIWHDQKQKYKCIYCVHSFD